MKGNINLERMKSYFGLSVPLVLFAVVTVIDAHLNHTGFWTSVPDGFSPILWIVIATASLVGLFVALALMFGKFARMLYVCWFAWALLYQSLEYGLKSGFQRSLNGEILQIAFTTNVHEAWTFIRETCSGGGGLVGVLCALVIGCRLLWRCRYPIPNLARVWCGVALVAFFFLCNLVCLHPVKAASRVGYFYWPVLAGVEYCRLKTLMGSLEKTKLPEVVATRKSEKPITGVFVIGESATRSRLGLYNRLRKTTPRLEALCSGELFVFSDLVGSAAGTVSAIRFLTTSLTLDGSEQSAVTLYSLLKRAGYFCPYIVNNAYDRPQGMLGLLFRDCSDIEDLRGAGGYDAQLIPYVERAIGDNSPNGGVITVNGCGSHFPFDKVAPRLPGAPEDNYDSTIFYTDWFLAEIIELLRETSRPAFLVYVSDHGESPDATIWRCLSDVATWELPFFIWTSDEYKAAFPDIVEAMRAAKNKPLQSDQLFFGLTRIMGLVDPPGYQAELDFLSPSFISRTNRRVQYGQEAYEKMKEVSHE